jgi:hypothetical protein
MPVLHKYADRDGYYVLTSIRGNIITYQLTDEGQAKLMDAGIEPDIPFERALLLDMVRSGEAFTGGSGPGTIDSGFADLQVQLDLFNDTHPETLFPSCNECSSCHDLHIVEIKGDGSQASILCTKCRVEKAANIDTSIPLFLVSRGVLTRLLNKKDIQDLDSSVKSYQELLDAEFESKWEAHLKPSSVQQPLFRKDSGNQKDLF